VNTHFDVAVLGAGMAGLTAARAPADSGKRVVLLEAGARGAHASKRSGRQKMTVSYNGRSGPVVRKPNDLPTSPSRSASASR